MTEEEVKSGDQGNEAAKAEAPAGKVTSTETSVVEKVDKAEYDKVINQIKEKDSLIGKHATELDIAKRKLEELESKSRPVETSAKPDEDEDRILSDDAELQKIYDKEGTKGILKIAQQATLKKTNKMIQDTVMGISKQTELIKSYPDLGNPKSEMYKAVGEEMSRRGLKGFQGAEAAAEIISLRMKTESLSKQKETDVAEAKRGIEAKKDETFVETNERGTPQAKSPVKLDDAQKKAAKAFGMSDEEYAKEVGRGNTYNGKQSAVIEYEPKQRRK